MKSTSVYIYTVGKATERTTDDYDLDDMIVSKAAAKKNEELEDVRRLNRAAADQLAEGGSNVKFIRKVFLLKIFKAGFVDGFAIKKQLDLDSQKINADPQPWFKCLQKFENSCANLNEEYVWLFREDP